MFKKIKKILKGLMASTLSATTTVSGIAAVTSMPVSAANEWVLETNVGGGAAFKLTNASTGHNYYQSEESFFTLVNSATGQRIDAFCMEPGKTTVAGNTYSESREAWDRIATEGQRRINIAGLWYEQYHSGRHGSQYSSLARTATQWYIWSVAGQYGVTGSSNVYDSIDWTWSENNSSDINRFNYARNFYNELVSFINNFDVKPNMAADAATAAKVIGNTSSGAPIYGITPGDTLTWYDTNRVLSDSRWAVEPSTVPGITITKNGNSVVMNISSDYRNTNQITLPTISEFKELRTGNFLVFAGNDIQHLVSPLAPRLTDPYDGEETIKLNVGKITVEKYDSIYGDVLANTTFEIYNSANEKVSTLTTGSDGKATSDWLLYDTYTVKEVEPSTGYNNDNTEGKTVVVDGESATVEFNDKIIQGWVELNKTDETTNQKLAGAEFEIHRLSGPNGTLSQAEQDRVIDTITTDTNGYAKSGLLDYGDYYLVEKTAAYGYYNPQTKYNFSITNEGATVTVNATNNRQTLEINVTKQDDNSDGFGLNADGTNIKLEGAEFGLYQHVILRDSVTNIKYYEDDVLIDTATSDANGLAKFELQTAYTSTLQFDSYYFVKELKAPVGYLLNDTEQTVVYEYGSQFDPAVVINLTAENEIMKAPITVYKQDVETDEYLAGATFEIKNANGVVVDTITTDSEGKAISKDLRPGIYTVTEIGAPEHYQLSNVKDWESNTEGTNTKSVEITINEDSANPGTYMAVGDSTNFKNLHDKGKIKLTKVDGLTVDYNTVCDTDGENCVSNPVLKEDSVLLPNVTFAIYAKDDLSSPVFTGTTNSDGELEAILNTGEYYIQEIAAPEGYNVNPALMAITLTTHGETVEKIITNMTIYGNISIYKIGETLTDATYNETSGITELHYENTYVGGVEFEVYANEDIYHPLTGKLIYAKDSLVRRVVTGTDGKVMITDMPLGTYYVKEVTAPAEHSVYDATSDVKYITLTEEDANFEGVIEDEARFMNERLVIDPQLYKVGAKLVKDTNSETEYEYNPLPGAIFGVYNEEDIAYVDAEGNNQTIKANSLLGVMETNEEGFADVEVKIPFGKYYVKEIQAPEGYYLNEDKYPFELVWKQELQENNTLTVSISDPENPIVNYEIVIPQTGVNSTTLYTVTGVIIIAIAGAAIVINKKRNIEE